MREGLQGAGYCHSCGCCLGRSCRAPGSHLGSCPLGALQPVGCMLLVVPCQPSCLPLSSCFCLLWPRSSLPPSGFEGRWDSTS